MCDELGGIPRIALRFFTHYEYYTPVSSSQSAVAVSIRCCSSLLDHTPGHLRERPPDSTPVCHPMRDRR